MNTKFNKALSVLTRAGYTVLNIGATHIDLIAGIVKIEVVSVLDVWRSKDARVEQLLNNKE